MSEGMTRSAVLLMALGEEAASEVLRRLEPKQVEGIVSAMAELRLVSKETVDEAVLKYSEESVSQNTVVPEPDAYVRAILGKAIGQEKAGLIIDRVLETREASGIDTLRWMDTAAVAELLRHEHPQIIASVLAHLESDQAAKVMNLLDEDLRSDVVTRIATLQGIQPAAMEDLTLVLNRVLAGTGAVKKINVGGIKTAADILNFMGANNQPILEAIGQADPELQQKLADQMFIFADLMKLDNKSIQLLLREIPNDVLIIAMKGCEPDLRDKFLGNMSQRAAETLREDLESKGPVRLAEVEAQQKEILTTVKRLAEEGQLTINTGGGDDFV